MSRAETGAPRGGRGGRGQHRAVVSRRAGAGLAGLVALAAAAAAALFVPPGPAEAAVEGAGAPGSVPGEYVVVFKHDSAEAAQPGEAAKALAKRYGATARRIYGTALQGFAGRMSETAARRLAAHPSVNFVEQDQRVIGSDWKDPEPSPPAVPLVSPAPSWGLDRIDQRDRTRGKLDGKYAHPNTARSVHAYVLDSGINIGHRDFGGRASYGYDFIDNDAEAADCNGHGTHVAGTLGGSKWGVAKEVRLVSVRVLDCGNWGLWSEIVAGVDWVTAHAVKPALANMSISGLKSARTRALDEAVRASIASGVTYVVAAGNDGSDACGARPAGVGGAITVGAVDNRDARPVWSNLGKCVDLFAPGVDITSASGLGGDATAIGSGTSMAAPHVAGAAAMILAQLPWYSPKLVSERLVGKATGGKLSNIGTGSPNKLLYVDPPQQPKPPTSDDTPPARHGR